MIEQMLIWVGENPVATLSFGIAVIALGVAIFGSKDVEPDEHAQNRFIG